MKTKDILKINLRNKGIEVLPSCYTKKGVILPFSFPKSAMKKYYIVSNDFEDRKVMFSHLLESFKVKMVKRTKKFYSSDFEEYVQKNSILLSKRLKHKDYCFSSLMVEEFDYEKLKEICAYYRISRSSMFRILIESYYSQEIV